MHGWASGFYGLVLRTTNGGAVWTQQPVSDTCDFTGIACGDVEHAWAAATGGEIYHTTDGGAVWSLQEYNSNDSFAGVSFANADTGVAVGRTWDGEESSTLILRTTDGGATWERHLDALSAPLLRVMLMQNGTGWAVGGGGTILNTTDFGLTWSAVVQNGDWALGGITLTDDHSGWAVGSHGLLLHTTDGFAHTTRQDQWLTEGFLTDVVFLDPLEGWVAVTTPDSSSILHTTDGGVTWTEQYGSGSLWVNCIVFTDAMHGWAADFLNGTSNVIHTTDGGATWSSQYESATNSIQRLFFTDGHHGWATVWGQNDSAMLLRTTDGGGTWSAYAFPATPYLRDLSFVNDSLGWGTASLGRVYRTTNGGESWALQDSFPGDLFLTNVTFLDMNHGWIAGSAYDPPECIIAHTSDGGLTWVTQYEGTSESFSDLAFADLDHGIAVGETGAILRTSDGGARWDQTPPCCLSSGAASLSFPTPNCAYLVGDEGTILRWEGPSSSGNPPVSVATAYRLSAYPNPFNPNTTLSFDIPASSRVKISIYDITGRLVQTLADRVFSQGNHRIEFDGSSLPSGMYFARMQGNHFSKTQKLVLLK